VLDVNILFCFEYLILRVNFLLGNFKINKIVKIIFKKKISEGVSRWTVNG